MMEATEHHVLNNRHHPEFHGDRTKNVINLSDRDKSTSEIINAERMSNIDIAEMCADWLAVSEERGTVATDWADKNINVRWKFIPEHVDLIYELIGAVSGD